MFYEAGLYYRSRSRNVTVAQPGAASGADAMSESDVHTESPSVPPGPSLVSTVRKVEGHSESSLDIRLSEYFQLCCFQVV